MTLDQMEGNERRMKYNNAVSYCYVKVALGVCFAVKSSKELIILFTYSIFLCKDITFPLITKFKSNRSLSSLSVNRISNTELKCGLTD